MKLRLLRHVRKMRPENVETSCFDFHLAENKQDQETLLQRHAQIQPST